VLPAIRGRVSADDVCRVLATASQPLPQCQKAGGRGQRGEAPTRIEGFGHHQPDFLSRQMTSRGAWKPSLKTIEELWQPRKIPHWLF
jgi:hypothetical protein